MASDEEVLEHYHLSIRYLESSRLGLDNDLYEPALFNAIHALELAVKSILLTIVDDPITTHNVGGKLGFYFRKDLGEECCRRINRILIRYNYPRYPGIDELDPEEVESTIGYIGDTIEKKVSSILIVKGILKV